MRKRVNKNGNKHCVIVENTYGIFERNAINRLKEIRLIAKAIKTLMQMPRFEGKDASIEIFVDEILCASNHPETRIENRKRKNKKLVPIGL